MIFKFRGWRSDRRVQQGPDPTVTPQSSIDMADSRPRAPFAAGNSDDLLPADTAADEFLRIQLAAVAAIEGGPMWGTAPKRWASDPTWRCTNLHVSKRCLEVSFWQLECAVPRCGSPVQLTFPGDRTGPLASIPTR